MIALTFLLLISNHIIMAVIPVAPMEVDNDGYWLPARAVVEYAGKEFAAYKGKFGVADIKSVYGITYIKSDSLVKALGGDRMYRPDIDRTIIDIPGMPVPLSMTQINDFPDGDRLYIQTEDKPKLVSVLPWSLYSNALPAIDKSGNMYWVNKSRIFYKSADVQNYQEIFRRYGCTIKIRGFDVYSNLICEIVNDKPGEHEIWLIKNDGTKKIITKGFNAAVSSSGKIIAFSRQENDGKKTVVYLKSLTTEITEVKVSDGSYAIFAPDSASLRYYKGNEIIHRSIIKDEPGEIISIMPIRNDYQVISGWSDNNKLLCGTGVSGIIISPADSFAPYYSTGNPADKSPQFWRDEMLFLRDSRLMKVDVTGNKIESEIFPGMQVSNYKVAADKLIFTAFGIIKQPKDFRINIDADKVVSIVMKVADCNINKAVIEQITTENAAGIISRKHLYAAHAEIWQNSVAIARKMPGFFDEQSGKIYLIPDNIRKIAEGKNEKEIAGMVLAHELVHLAQYEVNKNKPVEYDAQLAWAAVTEGQAIIVADKIAAEMNINVNISKKMSDFTKDDILEKLLSVQKIAGQIIAEIYRAGKIFMMWHYVDGGNKKMWEIIKNPPIVTDTIYTPHNYPEKNVKKDYAYLLIDINKLFPGNTRMINTAIGKLAQRIIYKDIDIEEREMLLNNINVLQTAAIENEYGTAFISVIILKEMKLTGKFIVAAEKIAIKENPGIIVETFVDKDIAGRKIKNGNSILYRVMYNTTVLEISTSNIKLTDESAAKIMRIVISRLKNKK